MSKQIAMLIDNSGSMFSPVGGGSATDKIVETSDGAELFIQNMISAISPGEEFAFSVHRFAQTYELFGAQTDTTSAGFAAALSAMESSISAIQNQAASQAAVGNLTDIYNAIHLTSDYMIANAPGFGAPDARYILLFSDGIQTVPHGGGTTRADYEAANGVTFFALLNGRNIRLRAWGIGSNALANQLRDLTNQAVDPSPSGGSVLFHPGSYTKVLFPESEDGTFPDCQTVFTSTATTLVDDNGILPLRPVGQAPSGLLWEQFSLPVLSSTTGHTAAVRQNHRDFEVDVDGATEVLILGLVSHSPGQLNLQATSPGGNVFTPATPGTVTVQNPTGRLFKIPNPELGTWRVRVYGDSRSPMTVDLMARGVCKKLQLAVHAEPFQLADPGAVTITCVLSHGDKPARGNLSATARVLGGDTATLARQDDGSFAGPVKVHRPGLNPVLVEVQGELEDAGSIHRMEFAEVLLGPATDPRFEISPAVFEQGRRYVVDLNLVDAKFKHATQVKFGSGIQVTDFLRLNANAARATINVARDAFVGAREVVTYNPNAEGLTEVQVVKAQVDRDRPGPRDVTGRVCCLHFDASGALVAIELCDGTHICVRESDSRLRKILEMARDKNHSVKVSVDRQKCLTGIAIYRR